MTASQNDPQRSEADMRRHSGARAGYCPNSDALLHKLGQVGSIRSYVPAL